MTYEEAKDRIRRILTYSHPIASWELEDIMDALEITPCDISTCKVANALWGNKGNIQDIDISKVKNGTPLEEQPTEVINKIPEDYVYDTETDEFEVYRHKYTGKEIHITKEPKLYKLEAQPTDAVSKHILVNLEDIIKIYSDKKNTNALNGDDDAFIEAVRECQKFQPCEDAVSRKAVLDLFAEKADAVRPYSEVWQMVKALSPVTPQRPKGKWIEIEAHNCHATLKCSVCNRVIEPTFTFGEYSYEDIKTFYPYCHCGAEMNGGGEE